MQVNIDNDTANEITKIYLKQMLDSLIKQENIYVDDEKDIDETIDGILRVFKYILTLSEFEDIIKKNKLRKKYVF